MNGYTPAQEWQRKAMQAPATDPKGFSVQQLVGIVVRRWRMACGIGLLSILAGTMIYFSLTPRYSAAALILIDPKIPGAIGPETNFGMAVAVDSAKIGSIAAVIQSADNLEQVVKSEKLYDDPEFGFVRPGLVARALSLFPAYRSAHRPADLEERTEVAVDRLQKAISIERESFTYVVSVAIRSSDPVKAARLAQAVSEGYINDQLQANREAAQRGAAWLHERIATMGKEINRSEQAVAEIQRTYGLTPTDGGATSTLASQRITELNAAIGAAETELSRKQAKLEQARKVRRSGGDIEGLPDVMASSVITQLRTQQADIIRKLAKMQPLPSQRDIVARRPDAIRAEEEQRAIAGQISAEIDRIIANMEDDYAASRAHVDALRNELTRLTGAGATAKDDGEAKLREAQSVANANRQVYSSLLNQSKELEQSQTKQVAEARIIEKARAPDRPSFPNRTLFIFASLGMGSVLGLGGAFAAEFLSAGRPRSSAFLVPVQVEQALCLPMLASVPLLTADDNRQKGGDLDFLGYLVANRNSHFAEALRSIRFGLLGADGDKLGKVIQITSAVPGEGKSVLAAALALSTALSGARVLLIDCDFRHPAATKLFGLTNTAGFGDLLSARAKWDEVAHSYPNSSLTVVAAGNCDHRSFDLIGSPLMTSLLKFASNHYDLVFLDGPPVLPVSDAALIAKTAEKTVLLIEWNKTDRDLVHQAIDRITRNDGTVAGVVLNKVNLDLIKSNGADYGRYYSSIESYYKRDFA